MNYKRLIVFLLCAALTVLCFGCSKSKGNTITANGEKYTFDYVMKIGDEEISLAEYRYYFLNLKLLHDDGDDSYWTDELSASLKDETEEYLLISRAVLQFAQQKGIALDKDDYDAIDDDIDALIAQYGKKEYKTMLEQNYTNEELYRKLMETGAIQTKLYDEVFCGDGEFAISDDEMREIVKTEFVRVRYLMLPLDTDGTGANKTLINTLLGRIGAGEDFAELVNAYGQESSMKSNPDGVYFGHGMVDVDFENACYSLGIDEISGVVECESGYYIIKRLEPEDTYITDSMDILRNKYQQVIFTEKVGAIADGLYVEYAPDYDKLCIDSIE